MTATRAYVVRPIDQNVAAALRSCDDAGRAPHLVVHDEAGAPLRCCLRPARAGESTMLVSYAPLRRWAAARGVDPGAYDEVGPVFICARPCDGPRADGFPPDLSSSPRVFRGYSADGRIVSGLLQPAGESPESTLQQLLDDDRVAVVHARAVGFGCFTFAVEAC